VTAKGPDEVPKGSRSARFLTHSVPSPGISGDRIRVFHLMNALKARGWTVRLWSLVGPDEPAGSADAIKAFADEVVLLPRDVSDRTRRLRVLRDIIGRRALQAHWFWSPASARAAAAWLADLDRDALFVEQLYMYPFVPLHLRPRVVLDTQNYETARMRAIAIGEGSLGRRTVARLQIGPVEAYERAALGSVGSVLAVSAIELDAFERMAPGRVRLVPNGVDARAVSPVSAPPRSKELFFLGSLGYGANIDAVRHFSTDIAPHLVGSGATLTVVGSHPNSTVHEAAAKAPIPMTVVGYAPDLRPYFSRCRAMVVPLRHGGGTRLKILEAMAWGIPVVTTSIGAEGLGLADGRTALIADDPAAFAAAVRRVTSDDDLWRDLSTAGRTLVLEGYDWKDIANGFENIMAVVANGTAVPRSAGLG
jgi:polysaccharide biosynthesis protein PslH